MSHLADSDEIIELRCELDDDSISAVDLQAAIDELMAEIRRGADLRPKDVETAGLVEELRHSSDFPSPSDSHDDMPCSLSLHTSR
jgi:hypothetical protein